MKYSFSLELMSGISVLITIGSLVMVTAFVLPAAVDRAQVKGSGFGPAAAAIR